QNRARVLGRLRSERRFGGGRILAPATRKQGYPQQQKKAGFGHRANRVACRREIAFERQKSRLAASFRRIPAPGIPGTAMWNFVSCPGWILSIGLQCGMTAPPGSSPRTLPLLD